MSSWVWTAPGGFGAPPRVVAMSPSVLLAAPPARELHGGPAGLQTPSLESPVWVTLGSGLGAPASHTLPCPSAVPPSHPCASNFTLNWQQARQNTGTVKPPGGLVTECWQVASAGAASTVVTIPPGNGNSGRIFGPNNRMPGPLVVSM